VEVQRILPTTIHMRGEVRAQMGQDLFVHGMPFVRELMQDARLRMDIVEDHTIGDQVAILDPFPLDRPVVRSNQALTPKEDPTDEAIECLALVGRGMKPPRSKLRGIRRKGIGDETPRFLMLFPLYGNP